MSIYRGPSTIGTSADATQVYALAAASSAATAAAEAGMALAHLNDFKGRYFGALTTHPTLDLLGNAVGVGDMYFNTAAKAMYVYDVSGWLPAGGASAIVNTFSSDGLKDSFELSVAPTSKSNTQVFVLGIYQNKDSYTLAGSTITFAEAPVGGTNHIDIVVVTSLTITSDVELRAELAAATGGLEVGANAYQTQDGVNLERKSVAGYGAAVDGVINDRSSIVLADAAGFVLFPAGTCLVSTNLTITSNCKFLPGAKIKPAAGVTVTLNGGVETPMQQIFDISEAGAAVTGNMELSALYAEWWGAAGVSASGDTAAWNAALTAAAASGSIPVVPLSKRYLFNGTLYGTGSQAQVAAAPSIRGAGRHVSIFDFSALPASSPCFKYIGTSGPLVPTIVEGIMVLGHTTSVAVENQGLCGLKFVRCNFDEHLTAALAHNAIAGQFTEFFTTEDCEFRANVRTVMEYKITSGNTSFHGTGLTKRCLIQKAYSEDVIKVTDASAYVYNAPLDFQIWQQNGAPSFNLINSNAATTPATFFGHITLEIPTTIIATLGATQKVQFTGTLNSTSLDKVQSGTMIIGQIAGYSSTGVAFVDRASKRFTAAMTTGANNLTGLTNATRIIDFQVVASNYEYHYLLCVGTTGDGSTVLPVTILATLRALNTAGYGAPTITCTPNGLLIVTNAGFPASGVTAIWFEQTLSARNHFGAPIVYI